ncbi:hypothetical protein J2741_002418 [Methanolinea mesophila]|uniref:DUF2150 family protein n=1 Tax=Methanolinea mesophila TaxID=547055 RepID=UPI001AEA51EA|nr:DUF2150 family protein [Methanolinea mesophila]MBP1929822.1 hypothetical protein [Methanolinea mesophila]
MAKKKAPKETEQPLKLFYIFYNQERWDNWIATLRESSFEAADDSEEMPEGYRVLYNFSMDITLAVLKIVRLYQNQRFSKEEALEKLNQVEAIVMSEVAEDELEEYLESIQLSMLVLFASCRKFLEGEYPTDIKSLVKEGKKAIDADMENALDIAASIGANVINGASCCGKYVKDTLDQPTLFDEWLIEIESMSEAMGSLKNFDEVAGED